MMVFGVGVAMGGNAFWGYVLLSSGWWWVLVLYLVFVFEVLLQL